VARSAVHCQKECLEGIQAHDEENYYVVVKINDQKDRIRDQGHQRTQNDQQAGHQVSEKSHYANEDGENAEKADNYRDCNEEEDWVESGEKDQIKGQNGRKNSYRAKCGYETTQCYEESHSNEKGEEVGDA